MTTDSSRLVFVGGLHRSGTTPLTRVLRDHPEISGLSDTGVEEDEGQHLQSVYPVARHHGGPGRFALPPAAHLTEDSHLATQEAGEQLMASWSPYWDTDRRLLLEKSPPNLIMGRFLQELFPRSALIVVLRNPVVVALSTRKWVRFTTLPSLVRHWFAAHDLLRSDAAHLDRLLVLRYEDLIRSPEQELSRIATFLELHSPIDPARLETSRSTRYEQAWEAMATGAPWLRLRRRQIERTWGERIASYGYDVRDLSVCKPWSWDPSV